MITKLTTWMIVIKILLLYVSLPVTKCQTTPSTTTSTTSSSTTTTATTTTSTKATSTTTHSPLWRRSKIPNPQIDVTQCGRGKKSWVCDPDRILTGLQGDKIDAAIKKLMTTTGGCHCGSKKCKKATFGYRGYRASVVIVNRVEMPYIKPSASQKKKVAADFADYLRDEDYEFGHCNDDLVIFVSRVDRLVYTATGEQMSSVLTNSCVNTIFQTVKGNLSVGNYGAGILDMISQYNLALQRNHLCNKRGSTSSPTVVGVVIALMIVVVMIVSAVCFVVRRGCGNVGITSHGSRHSHSSHSSHSSHGSAGGCSEGGGGGEF